MTARSATSVWGREIPPFHGSAQSRHLARIEPAATSTVTVGSTEFSVNGRPSEAAKGGVTHIRLTRTDDGNVRAERTVLELKRIQCVVFIDVQELFRQVSYHVGALRLAGGTTNRNMSTNHIRGLYVR